MKTPITRELIGDPHLRLGMLPRHFGQDMMRVESSVFHFADKLCREYKGGFWHYYELSNGGFYMAPDMKDPVHLIWRDNGHECTIGADGFGIVCCLFTYSHLSFILPNAVQVMAKHYHCLLDYADSHHNSKEIFNICD